MRATRRHFTMNYPAQRAEPDWLPPEFDLAAVDALANAPLDPLVAECLACRHGRGRCRPEAFFKPECRPAETEAPGTGAEAVRRLILKRAKRGERIGEQVRQGVVATLHRRGSCTIYEIQTFSGLKYGTLRTYLQELVEEGLVIVETRAPIAGKDHLPVAKLYRLASLPAGAG